MKHLRTALLALTLVCTPLLAAAPGGREKSIELKVGGDTVIVVQKMPCTVTAPEGADLYIWNVPDNVKASSAENVLIVTEAPKGRANVSVIAVTFNFEVGKDGKITKTVTKDRGTIVLTIGVDPTPPGPGPNPPTPPTPPTPPDPPAPIPGDGLRVLMVYDPVKTPPAQLNEVVRGKDVRDYLNAKCATDADGKTKAYRIWTADTDASGDDKVWVDAFGRKRASVPWLVISNGKTGYEGPMPATAAETLALLKKYGG